MNISNCGFRIVYFSELGVLSASAVSFSFNVCNVWNIWNDWNKHQQAGAFVVSSSLNDLNVWNMRERQRCGGGELQGSLNLIIFRVSAVKVSYR